MALATLTTTGVPRAGDSSATVWASPRQGLLVPNMLSTACWVHCQAGWPLRGLQHGVALRQVLDGAHQDGGEGLEHALSPHRNRGDAVDLARVQGPVHELHVHDLGQVALVVLEHQGHGGGVEAMGQQVLGHLPEALEVLLPPVLRGVGHEDQAVGVLQHEPPRGGVHGLAGNGQDLQAQVEAAEARAAQGQEVEEDGAVLRGVDGDHLAAPRRLGVLVQDLEVGRLAAHRGAVIDDLDLDLPVAVIELDHR